jgi:acetyl-CoA carboxylase biotin carboxyl carrier protein
MELKEIQDLIKFVAKSGVSEVELESKGFKIVIKTGKGSAEMITAAAAPVIQHVPQSITTAPAAAAAPPNEAPTKVDESKFVTIKSPMIGTFYLRPSPDKDPFVTVGSEIKPGTVLCVIEAMKLFNEIEAEISGKIVKLLVDDSSPVEYDQPLFLVEPV